MSIDGVHIGRGWSIETLRFYDPTFNFPEHFWSHIRIYADGSPSQMEESVRSVPLRMWYGVHTLVLDFGAHGTIGFLDNVDEKGTYEQQLRRIINQVLHYENFPNLSIMVIYRCEVTYCGYHPAHCHCPHNGQCSCKRESDVGLNIGAFGRRFFECRFGEQVKLFIRAEFSEDPINVNPTGLAPGGWARNEDIWRIDVNTRSLDINHWDDPIHIWGCNHPECSYLELEEPVAPGEIVTRR